MEGVLKPISHIENELYFCLPMEENGLFYHNGVKLIDQVETVLLKVFLGRDVQMTYDSYNIRHQFGGHEIEDREYCWYEWGLPEGGSVRIDLYEQCPDTVPDKTGYAKVKIQVDGTADEQSLVKDNWATSLSMLQNRGIEYMSREQVNQVKEPRIVALRRSLGRCRWCGEEFKGLLVKKCSKCGREKDY